ncbi:AcrR family transcriptional regulator [Rhodococcus sp. SORGH_AS 301]|nr:AcrR family transcriptional regulator [Rhodococcus sp. SORGH_AS_0301]
MSQLTLRPLAGAIGVTISTLIRQFGSKGELIEEITRNVNTELLNDLRTDPELVGVTPVQTLRTLWRRWLDPVTSRHFRLMFELYSLALQDPSSYKWFIESVVADWLSPITERLVDDGADRDQARVVATVVLATMRGLHLDYIATRDADRIDAAFELVVASLAPIENRTS